MLHTVLKDNHKSWDEYLPHIECAYNRVVYKTTMISPFEVVYDFNPLIPLDLVPLPNQHEFQHKEGVSKADFIKKLLERVQNQIEQQTKRYIKQNNKEKKEMIFKDGDWVWLHLRKYRFPKQRKSKLNPRGDGHFQVLKIVNDNAYILDLLGKYGLHTIFNVIDLISFIGGIEDDAEVLNLRRNHFQERGDDGRSLRKQPTIRAMGKI